MGAHDDNLCAARLGGWTLHAEVLALSVHNGQIYFRHLSSIVPPSTPPHEVALALTDTGDEDPASLCHSTSWRSPAPGRVVVTYVVLPDRMTADAVPLQERAIIAADDGLCPEPGDVDAQNVATHAVRHLAMLSREDPTVQALVPHAPALWQCIVATAGRAETSASASADERRTA